MIRAIRKLVHRERPTIVHTHAYKADVLARIALGQAAPQVITAHGFTGGNLKNRIYEWIDQQVMKRASAVIAVSDALTKQLEQAGVHPHRIHWVPNGAIAPAFLDRRGARRSLGLDHEMVVIGWVGRLSREKGPDVFIESASHVSATGTQFVLIGAGPLESSLRSRAASLAPARDIRLLGRREDAAQFLRGFDMLVLSSRTEGSPIIIAEALQAGIPIVATAVGDVPRLADTLGSIVLAEPGDSRDLAVKITATLQDLPVHRAHAEEARSMATDIVGPASWVRALEHVYQLVCANQ